MPAPDRPYLVPAPGGPSAELAPQAGDLAEQDTYGPARPTYGTRWSESTYDPYGIRKAEPVVAATEQAQRVDRFAGGVYARERRDGMQPLGAYVDPTIRRRAGTALLCTRVGVVILLLLGAGLVAGMVLWQVGSWVASW